MTRLAECPQPVDRAVTPLAECSRRSGGKKRPAMLGVCNYGKYRKIKERGVGIKKWTAYNHSDTQS